MDKKIVVAIAREFGSGGHEIGMGLAKSLDINYYDKEILKAAAKESGIVEEVFEKADEKPASSLLYSLHASSPFSHGGFIDYSDYLTNDKLFLFQSETIRNLAQKSSCVFIGRCADYILRGNPHLFTVYVHCSLELRIQRIAKLYNMDEDAARSLVKKTDKSRSNYYSFYTDGDWGRGSNYDLCIDSGKFGIDAAVEIIKNSCNSLINK